MSSAPRPPFAPSQQMRPQMGAPAPGSPSPRQPMPQAQGMNSQQQRQMAPPQLRRVDSQGNVLPNQGQPPRPGMQQQVRPPSSGGTTSPPGQGGPGPRPQGAFPWTGPPSGQQNRPPAAFGNQPQNQGGRPPFPRPGSGGPGNQPQFRPPYQQQQQYQGMPQQFPPQVQQRPFAPQGGTQPSSPMSKTNSHDDDDSDVVFGQAVTPLKMPSAGAPAPVKLNQVLDDVKTNPELVPSIDTNAKNASFGDSNGKKHLKDIDEEETENRPVESKANETTLGSSESGSHSTKLTNFQKISGDVSEKTNKPENPNKIENSRKPDGSPKEATFNKDIKGDNDSGVDESTQEKDRNGPTSPSSPAKTPTKPTSGISRPPSATPSNKSTKSRSASRSRLALKTPEPDTGKIKVPMNKIQVGNAPSPNLKAVRSKIGSLDNATYKPGGGKIKIESKKIEIKAAPRIEAKNDKYTPKGGDKKIVSTKLQWNAKSKIGSLENANHKPGGGDKKIDTIKADFKDKAKPKVGSKDNVKYAPGGGDIKIQTHKLEIKAQSKIGSLDNVKHKPGGGDKKIFDDKDYLKNVEHPVALTSPSQFWKAPKITRATTLTSSMSLPAECLVLSVSMPSLNDKRPKSAGPKSARKPGQAIHPKPFRLF
ncbi:microtubule-associated protein tau isoform X2 [Episyrphus balteatus]|uniref:microtubule-associated protein tau isoform X2 n=1 Tax=Episyrphus balteatus TaxID=286459 RepID=UPI0024865AD6|nr:microtubule-associated protein tau isoform X2 [Episyrphus balteatus]